MNHPGTQPEFMRSMLASERSFLTFLCDLGANTRTASKTQCSTSRPQTASGSHLLARDIASTQVNFRHRDKDASRLLTRTDSF